MKDARFVTVRADNACLRIALPEFGSISIGSSERCSLRLDRGDVAEEQVTIFLDHGMAIRPNDSGGKLARGADRTRLDGDATVDVQPGDVVEVGPLLLQFSQPDLQQREYRVWSANHLQSQLQDKLWTGDTSQAVLVVDCDTEFDDAVEQWAREADLVGRGPDGSWLLLTSGEAQARALSRVAREQFAGASVGVAVAEGDDAAAVIGRARRRAGRRHDASFQVEAQSEAMQEVMRLVEQVATSNALVLLQGETGAGKDTIAALIHQRSERAGAPLHRLNAVELDKAVSDGGKNDVLQGARGATLYLGEVSDLSARAQMELTGLLEAAERQYDVRVIASSHAQLEQSVSQSKFRQDLYFRLSRMVIRIPSLRERKKDVAALAQTFARQAAERAGRPVRDLSPSALAALEAYDWPGNVRELQNVVERGVLVGQSEQIELKDLPLRGPTGGQSAPVNESPDNKPSNLREEMEALERRRILEALDAYPTQAEAARALGIPIRTFTNRLDSLGIPRPRKKD